MFCDRHLTFTVVASKQALLGEGGAGGRRCEEELQAVHAEAFEATRAAQQAGLQQRMAQRAAMPGFTELQGVIRGWRDGHQKLKQVRKAMKRLLPEPAERESLLADMHRMMPPAQPGTALARRTHELEKAAGLTTLDSDPLGTRGVGAARVREARARCGYHAQALALLLDEHEGDEQLVAALQARDFVNRSAVDVAAQAGAADAVAALLDAAEGVQAVEGSETAVRAALVAGCAKCLEELGPDATRGDWWEKPPPRHFPQSAVESEEDGWGFVVAENEEASRLREFGCDGRVAVRQTIGWREFLADFISVGRPLLLLEPLAPEDAAEERQRWSMAELLERHGATTVRRASIPYAAQFGLPDDEREVELRHFVEAEMRGKARGRESSWRLGQHEQYVFNEVSQEALGRGAERWSNASYTSDEQRFTSLQWYLGPLGSGAPIHYHGHAINHLVHGCKLWTLLPPEEAAYTRQPLSRWLAQEPEAADAAITCVQPAGSALFVPSGWGHGVLNLQESLGYAREFVMGLPERADSSQQREQERARWPAHLSM